MMRDIKKGVGEKRPMPRRRPHSSTGDRRFPTKRVHWKSSIATRSQLGRSSRWSITSRRNGLARRRLERGMTPMAGEADQVGHADRCRRRLARQPAALTKATFDESIITSRRGTRLTRSAQTPRSAKGRDVSCAPGGHGQAAARNL